MRSKRPTETDSEERNGGSLFHFGRDNRAIEGLPIRLVIAIVIGVAALAIMMTMLDGLDQFNDEELSIEFEDSVIEEGDDFTVIVVDENGNEVEDATVVVSEGTARIDESGSDRYVETNGDGEAEFDSFDTSVPQGQSEGTLTFEVQPPEDSSYAAGEDLQELLVVES